MMPPAHIPPIAVVIPAHNEAVVLPRTLAHLRAAVPPPNTIIVIADHCTDGTEKISALMGAVALRRDTGEGSKGRALCWLFEQHPSCVDDYPVTVILDADSTVSPSFFEEVRQAFSSAAQVVQAFVQPIQANDSTISTLAAYVEVLSQVVDDTVRARLGWPVRLRGTGMAFQTRLLRKVLDDVHMRTEDVELSLLLAERRVPVIFLPGAVVYGRTLPLAIQIS